MSKKSEGHTPVPYDFRRPTTLARDHSRALEADMDGFTRMWGVELGTAFHTKMEVRAQTPALSTYGDYSNSLPAQTVMVLCTIGDTNARMVVQIPNAAALTWTSWLVGGDPDTDIDPAAVRFSPTETVLIRSIVDGLIDGLSYALTNRLDAKPAIEQVQFNSQFTQAALQSELMVVLSMNVRGGNPTEEQPVTIAIPAEAILPNMESSHTKDTPEAMAERIPSTLKAVPVEARLQYQNLTATPAQVLAWTEGSRIPLRHDLRDELLVKVAGIDFANARPAQRGTRKTMKITTVKESRQ